MAVAALRRRVRGYGEISRAAAEAHGASRADAAARIAALMVAGGFTAREALGLGLLDPAVPLRVALRDHASKRRNDRAQARLNPPEFLALTEDKEVFARAVAERNLPAARTIAVIDGPGGRLPDGSPLGGEEGWTRLIGADAAQGIVVKPVDGYWGRGVRVLRRDGGSWAEGDQTLSARELHRSLREGGRHIVQERLVNHPDMQALNPSDALQTVRLTMLLDGGGVHVLGAMVKLAPRHAMIDNYEGGRTGAMTATVDPVSGAIRDVWVPRPGALGGPVAALEHPVTGARLVGAPLPRWEEAVALAERASVAFAPLRTIGWDIAITQHGPVLVEGNANWDPFPQPGSGPALRRLRAA